MPIRKIIISVWILFLLSCVIFGCFNRQFLEPLAIADFLKQFSNIIFFLYFLLSILRGFTLFPSTPLVLAGTILFPNQPFEVLFVSIIGIIFSSTMIYYFSDCLGFGNYLEEKYPNKISKIKLQLKKPTGFLFVFLWSFFPILPTDAVCYVAGVLRMNFNKYILAVACGEIIICSIYIFFYSYLCNIFT